MKKLFYSFSALAALCLGVSCEEPAPEPQEPEVSVQVSGIAGSVSFTAAKESKTFNVKVNYDWTIASDADWLTLDVTSGVADQITAVTASSSENESTDARTATITISVEGKDGGKTIPVQQAGYDGPAKDSHAAGFEFYTQDFNWIKDSWNDAWAKWGWSSATPAGYSKNNECAVGSAGSEALVAAFADKGLEIDTLENATYAKYEGFVKLGKTGAVGFVTIPALGTIDADCIATLDVAWDASLYIAPNGTYSGNQYQIISVLGEGKITSVGTAGAVIADDSKSVKIPLDKDEAHKWCWTRKHIIVAGADAQTRIMFGKAESLDARSFLDNISITRADDKNAVAASDAVQELPALSYEVGTASKASYLATGESGSFTVHANRGWTVTTDAEWLNITGIACGTENYGNTVAPDGKSAEACASGLLYSVNFVVSEHKQETQRTAVLKVMVGGQQIGSVSVTQNAYVAPSFTATPVAKWSWTSLFTTSTNEYTKAAANAWISGDHTYASDAVKGGVFSCSIANSAAAYSVGTATQKKDRLRVNKLTRGDYFQFKVDGINAAAGDSIQFTGVSIGVTNAGTSPNKWEAQYSFDGNTWTKYFEVEITAAADYPSVGCVVPVAKAISNGSFYVRVVSVNDEADYATRTNIVMVILTADNNVADKDTYYTENWAYATVNVLSPAK